MRISLSAASTFVNWYLNYNEFYAHALQGRRIISPALGKELA